MKDISLVAKAMWFIYSVWVFPQKIYTLQPSFIEGGIYLS